MSNNKKMAVIIGAGPSGLACAYELINQNPSIKPIIIEKNSYVGGLAHTITNDCFGYDIFGYKLKTDYQYIKNIWFKFLKPQNSPAIDDIYSARYIQYPNLGVNPNEEDDVMLIRRDFSSIYKNSQFLLYSLGVNFSLIKQVGFKDFFSIIFSAIKSFIFKKPEITAKDGNKNKFTIGGEVSLLSMNVYAEVPIGQKITTMLAFRRSYQGYLWDHISGQKSVSSNQTAVDRPANPFGENSRQPAYFYDLNAKVTYTPTKKDII